MVKTKRGIPLLLVPFIKIKMLMSILKNLYISIPHLQTTEIVVKTIINLTEFIFGKVNNKVNVKNQNKKR